jgi:RNA polymerase sigma-70 factor (ECF subfamily)
MATPAPARPASPYRPCQSDEPTDVAALRRGDERAYRCLVQAQRQRLFHYVVKIVKDDDEARNIVQETFAEAYRQMDQFRGEAKVSTWLFSIARHLAYGFLRKAKRHSYLEHDTIDYLASEDGRTASSWSDVRRREDHALVHDALADLPEHYRRVVELRDLKEWTTEETAEALELTEVNVRVRLYRARKKLRKALLRRVDWGEA